MLHCCNSLRPHLTCHLRLPSVCLSGSATCQPFPLHGLQHIALIDRRPGSPQEGSRCSNEKMRSADYSKCVVSEGSRSCMLTCFNQGVTKIGTTRRRYLAAYPQQADCKSFVNLHEFMMLDRHAADQKHKATGCGSYESNLWHQMNEDDTPSCAASRHCCSSLYLLLVMPSRTNGNEIRALTLAHASWHSQQLSSFLQTSMVLSRTDACTSQTGYCCGHWQTT